MFQEFISRAFVNKRNPCSAKLLSNGLVKPCSSKARIKLNPEYLSQFKN
jgi:hypothetical protein